jgi:hypothetical protein
MSSDRNRLTALAETMRGSANEDCFGTGLTSADVEQLELRLGAVLPDSYKDFLREFGYACWPDYIYGVHSIGLPGLDLVAETEEARTEGVPPLPPQFVPFSPDGWGNSYCFDTERMVDGECPVVLWRHERDSGQQPETTHPSFLDWLEYQIEIMLEE